MTADDEGRWLVTLRTNVSIDPDRYVEVVVCSTVRPFDAVQEAIRRWEQRGITAWQSRDMRITVERVA